MANYTVDIEKQNYEKKSSLYRMRCSKKNLRIGIEFFKHEKAFAEAFLNLADLKNEPLQRLAKMMIKHYLLNNDKESSKIDELMEQNNNNE